VRIRERPRPTTALLATLLAVSLTAHAGLVPYRRRWDVKLESLPPAEVLSKLNLTGPGLEEVKAAADRGNPAAALTALREYYRAKYPLPKRSPKNLKRRWDIANGIVDHSFQWGPYHAADYGDDINWEWDPADDIEWVAAVYRFYWADPLAKAYAATRDEKYARAFVELTTDWIDKHPLENWTSTHPVYKRWKGFAWLDLQTGIRARRICDAFKTLVHGNAFTPEFLGVLLASLYDHQRKTELIPMGIVHNKAIFEQRGFVNVAATFPEFKDARRWAQLGLDRTRENLLAQVTDDGVQREWCGSYHLGVLNDAVDVMRKVEPFGIDVPDDYRRCIRRMYDYIFAIATPDLGFPMFGDTARPLRVTDDRSQWALYSTLIRATDLLGEPKYAGRARLGRTHLPDQAGYAFRNAGSYVMRSDWGPEQVYFVLHCPPPGISGHDQPDNGTFELYAYGRWLMTDTGFYTYGHDPDARRWHRATRVHQTLTLDGKDARIDGKLLLWQIPAGLDALVVENRSYENLLHRRSVWFVDRRFFVLFDEAIGDAAGALDLHFQLAPGPARLVPDDRLAVTAFEDANVLVRSFSDSALSLEEEEGWFAWEYGSRKARNAFRYRHGSPAPATFLTILAPFRGTDPPDVKARPPERYQVGAQRVELVIEVGDMRWRVGRDLRSQTAWAEPSRRMKARRAPASRLESSSWTCAPDARMFIWGIRY